MGTDPIADVWVILAATSGALLPVALSSERSRGRAVVKVICGTTLAVFLAPAVARRYMPGSDAELRAAVAFMVGCFGLNLTIIIQRVLKSHGEKLVRRVVGSFLTRMGKGGRRRESRKGSDERIRHGSRGAPADEGK